LSINSSAGAALNDSVRFALPAPYATVKSPNFVIRSGKKKLAKSLVSKRKSQFFY